MQKITPFGRLILVLLVLGAGFGIFKLLQNQGIIPENFLRPSPAPVTDNPKTPPVNPDYKPEDKPQPDNNTTPSTPAPDFAYTPPEPENGKLKGVVELGASGFNSFVVRIDAAKRWKLEKAEFGNSLVMENMASEDDIRAGLKRYIGIMLDYGVGARDIHFVVSSGASKTETTQKIIAALKMLNYFVNTVTPEQEGSLGLKCVLPELYEDRAFVTDIGSSNTKISWKDNGKVTALETQGSKYFQKNEDDAKVYEAVSAKAKQVPASHNKTCFIIGGVPFNLAKQVRKGKERYTILKAADAYDLKDAKDKAGRNIYKAVADATGCQQFVFDWDANFTIGFLLTLP